MAKHKHDGIQEKPEESQLAENNIGKSGSEPNPDTTLAQKEKEINQLNEAFKELTDTLQRLQAEFENYRKRCDRDNASFIKLANEELISDLLSILDNFELAFRSHKGEESQSSLSQGMELIYAELYATMEAYGLKRIDCLGTKFDPHYHEVLMTQDSNEKNNTIIQEIQKGYMLNDKVIRHSKVKIAKNNGEKKEEEAKKEDKEKDSQNDRNNNI